MRVLAREVLRAIDRRAVLELGLPGVVLMENAGRGAAELGLELLGDARAPQPVLVLCGSGNNGGDGYVVARHLASAGHAVVCAASVPASAQRGDAALMRAVVERSGSAVIEIGDDAALARARARVGRVALVVDALLGTGFAGERVRAPLCGAIAWAAELRRHGARVLALDVPSGLDCDSGRAATPTVAADATATFVAAKPGFARAPELIGRVTIVPIGVPQAWLERVIAGAAGGGS